MNILQRNRDFSEILDLKRGIVGTLNNELYLVNCGQISIHVTWKTTTAWNLLTSSRYLHYHRQRTLAHKNKGQMIKEKLNSDLY